jgi:hypothetical protein
MKLRIQGNSVRVRVTQTEVRQLAAHHPIEQATEFPGSSKLITRLECQPPTNALAATFADGVLIARLPSELVRVWAETDQVGIEACQPLPGGKSLHILIEKDFDCLHPRPQENVDTFPNPKSKS